MTTAKNKEKKEIITVKKSIKILSALLSILLLTQVISMPASAASGRATAKQMIAALSPIRRSVVYV